MLMSYFAQIERDWRLWNIASLAALLLAGCATLSSPRLPSADTRDWTAYQIEIGNQTVRFEIPPDESTDFPAFEIPRKIDLSDPRIFDQSGSGPELLARFWDYRTSRSAPVDGTLRAYILLWHSEGELTNVAALASALAENASLTKVKELLQGGTGGPHDKLKFEPLLVAGKQGLLVHHETSPAHYAVALDEHHYLTIYVSGAGVTRPDWRENARAAAAAIFYSIQIESRE